MQGTVRASVARAQGALEPFEPDVRSSPSALSRAALSLPSPAVPSSPISSPSNGYGIVPGQAQVAPGEQPASAAVQSAISPRPVATSAAVPRDGPPLALARVAPESTLPSPGGPLHVIDQDLLAASLPRDAVPVQAASPPAAVAPPPAALPPVVARRAPRPRYCSTCGSGKHRRPMCRAPESILALFIAESGASLLHEDEDVRVVAFMSLQPESRAQLNARMRALQLVSRGGDEVTPSVALALESAIVDPVLPGRPQSQSASCIAWEAAGKPDTLKAFRNDVWKHLTASQRGPFMAARLEQLQAGQKWDAMLRFVGGCDLDADGDCCSCHGGNDNDSAPRKMARVEPESPAAPSVKPSPPVVKPSPPAAQSSGTKHKRSSPAIEAASSAAAATEVVKKAKKDDSSVKPAAAAAATDSVKKAKKDDSSVKPAAAVAATDSVKKAKLNNSSLKSGPAAAAVEAVKKVKLDDSSLKSAAATEAVEMVKSDDSPLRAGLAAAAKAEREAKAAKAEKALQRKRQRESESEQKRRAARFADMVPDPYRFTITTTARLSESSTANFSGEMRRSPFQFFAAAWVSAKMAKSAQPLRPAAVKAEVREAWDKLDPAHQRRFQRMSLLTIAEWLELESDNDGDDDDGDGDDSKSDKNSGNDDGDKDNDNNNNDGDDANGDGKGGNGATAAVGAL